MASDSCRRVLQAAEILICTLCLTACGGGNSQPLIDAQAESQAASPDQSISVPAEQSLDEVVAGIQSSQHPDGMDAMLWDQLTAELVSVLRARDVSRIAATPPTGEDNGVLDLHFDPNASDVALAWTHVCVGDYNHDGLVSINDITPIGQHYMAAADDFIWAVAQLADGNGDGMITINDITQIGQHYLVHTTAYNVYGSTDPTDYPDSPDAENGPGSRLVASVEFSTAASGLGGRALFSAAVDSPAEGEYYWVRPTDGEALGSPSNTITADTRGDWWMHGREETHNGRSPYFGPRSNDVAWTYTTGDAILGGPVLRPDGWVYIGSADDSLHAVNPQGGGEWTFPTGGDIVGTPAIGLDGTVYFGSEDGNLYALNPDGSLQWNYSPSGGAFYSPAIAPDGTIYAGCADDSLHALLPDMTVAWTFPTGGDVQSCPAIGADGAIYFGSDDGNVYALSDDGSERWTFATGEPVVASVALATDGTVYVAGHDQYFYAIGPNGNERWRYETYAPIEASPAIGADGTIYFGDWAARVYAISPDGTERWIYFLRNDIHTAPAIGADGIIYVGCDDDSVYALNPDGTLHWRYETGGDIGMGLALGADGTLFAGSADGNLYAFSGGPGGTPPTIEWMPTFDGAAGGELTLSAEVTGTPPITFEWDLGGGAEPNEPAGAEPTVALGDPGVYAASLTISNGFAPPDTRDFELYVHDPAPPTSGWEHSWGEYEDEGVRGLAVDAAGHLHAVGYTRSTSNREHDVLLLEYDPAGTLLRARSWDSGTSETGYAIAIDEGGDIYIAGGLGEYGPSSTLLLRFNQDGELLWARGWDGPDAEGYGLAVASDGRIFLAGTAYNSDSASRQTLLLTYDADGNLQDVSAWDSPDEDGMLDIALDGEGNVYAYGKTLNYDEDRCDSLLLRMNNSGTLSWVKAYVTPDPYDGGGHLAVDAVGNCYVTTRGDAVLMYNAAGELQWARTWLDGGSTDTRGIARRGNALIVCGAAKLGEGGNWNAAVLVGDTSGGVAWGRQHLTGYIDDFLLAACFDEEGTAYVGGNGTSILGTWQDLAVTSAAAVGIDTIPTGGIVAPPDGTPGGIDGTLTDITGVEDTGGGMEDATVFCLELEL